MFAGTHRFILTLVVCAASASASAQAVYKCGRSGARTYSDHPCSNRVLDTSDAPVPVSRTPHRVDEDRALARSLHRRHGETAAQFAARRHRTGLPAADRAECSRLDRRIPVEQARMKLPDAAEISAGAAAFDEARQRFAKLGC